VPPASRGLYNELQFCGKLHGWYQKSRIYVLLGILDPNSMKRMPGGIKYGGHHTLMTPLLRRQPISNTNAVTPPSSACVYLALPCGPNFVGLCMFDLSMSKHSGFADVLAYHISHASWPKFSLHSCPHTLCLLAII
jgi:hypothetical protein